MSPPSPSNPPRGVLAQLFASVLSRVGVDAFAGLSLILAATALGPASSQARSADETGAPSALVAAPVPATLAAPALRAAPPSAAAAPASAVGPRTAAAPRPAVTGLRSATGSPVRATPSPGAR